MKCLTEIGGVQVAQYDGQFVQLFTLAMNQLKEVCSIIINGIRLLSSVLLFPNVNTCHNLIFFIE